MVSPVIFSRGGKALRQGRTCPVQMREARIEMLVYKSAPPLCAAHRLFAARAVPLAVESQWWNSWMGKLSPGPEEHTVRVCAQRGIAERTRRPASFCFARQNARHRPALPLGVREALPQIEEASALGRRGQAGLDLLLYLAQKRGIFTQFSCVKFRVAAGRYSPPMFSGRAVSRRGLKRPPLPRRPGRPPASRRR